MRVAPQGRGRTFLLAAILAASAAQGAAAQAPAMPAAPAPPFDAQLRALGDPGSLAFLRRLDALPAINPQLAGSIMRRLEGAAGGGAEALAAAERDIRARLTADAIAHGNGLSAPVAARSLGLSLGRDPGAAQAWRETLGIAAIADDARLAALGFDRLLRPDELESLLSASMTRQLVGGGTPVRGGGNLPPLPPTQPAAGTAPSVTPLGATPVGATPSQVERGAAVIVGGGTRATQRTLRCETRFEELAGRYNAATSRRTEPFDPAEFREVLLLTTRDIDGQGGQTCTGTLIAGRWVLTAAHCVMYRKISEDRIQHLSTASVTGVRGRDFDQRPAGGSRPYATRAPDANGNNGSPFFITRVIAHHGYDPQSFANDVALLELAEDASDGISAIPAALGRPPSLASPVTVAGYGYTSENPQGTGTLNVGWPPAPQRNGSFLEVSYRATLAEDGGTRICPGDSGGPVFAGRHRGCRAQPQWPHVATEAPRPRVILGVNSHIENVDPRIDPSLGRDGRIDGTECGTTRWNRMVDVTAPAMREWICSRTGGAAGGCSP